MSAQMSAGKVHWIGHNYFLLNTFLHTVHNHLTVSLVCGHEKVSLNNFRLSCSSKQPSAGVSVVFFWVMTLCSPEDVYQHFRACRNTETTLQISAALKASDLYGDRTHRLRCVNIEKVPFDMFVLSSHLLFCLLSSLKMVLNYSSCMSHIITSRMSPILLCWPETLCGSWSPP
jgi:hypothetical protein